MNAELIAKSVFWGALGLLTYSYVLYPVLVGLWARLARRTPAREICAVTDWPTVTLVVAAYKEERFIQERLENAARTDYPEGKFDVVIGCDGQEDRTGQIVAAFDDRRVRLLQFPQRRGKASVLNDAVPTAAGEIVLFSDANTFLDADATKRIVRHFEDPTVGGVVGKLILTDGATGKNVDGLYWRYENFVKTCEGKIGALLGANGAIYAIRKSLWRPIPANTIVDDFLIGMRIHESGHKLVYDATAIANEETAPSIADEFHRRARIGAGGFQSLAWLAGLLAPWHGRVAWAFWSHKVLRWLGPVWMLAMLIANIALLTTGEPLYRGLLALQGGLYLAAFLGSRLTFPGAIGKLLKVAALFVNMNAALFVGLGRWLRQSQGGVWKRTERSAAGA